MNRLRKRITAVSDAPPRLAASDVTVEAALRRLEAGETPARVFGEHPADYVAAIAFSALDEASPGPPLVRRPPPRPRLAAAVSEAALAELFPEAPRPARLSLSAGLLLILDAWEASHEAAQEADDLGERRFAAYWHGIAHRREPDAGNASYWFRRVGRHPLFPVLAEAAAPILEAHAGSEWKGRLAGPKGWDPLAMIELCTRARGGSEEEALARRLQRLEMGVLLEATAEAVEA